MKGKEFSKTLFQTMHEMKSEIRGMRNERHENILERFAHEESPSSSYDVCEDSVTQSDLQHCSMPTFLAREEAEGETPKEETLGDYLQEYESQSKRFKEHLSFLEFCQLKEERRSNRDMRRRECMQPTLGYYSGIRAIILAQPMLIEKPIFIFKKIEERRSFITQKTRVKPLYLEE